MWAVIKVHTNKLKKRTYKNIKLNSNNIQVHEPNKIANIFHEYFSSLGNKDGHFHFHQIAATSTKEGLIYLISISKLIPTTGVMKGAVPIWYFDNFSFQNSDLKPFLDSRNLMNMAKIITTKF